MDCHDGLWVWVAKDSLVDGEVRSLIVHYDICFLEEGTAKGVLSVVSASAYGEIIC